MRVGIVGLGDIAEKAWLPVLLAQDGIEPVLVDHFVGSVRSRRLLDASDALVTHLLCERVVQEVEELLSRPV